MGLNGSTIRKPSGKLAQRIYKLMNNPVRCSHDTASLTASLDRGKFYSAPRITTLDKWLWEIYFPQHFPDYERHRVKCIGLPAPNARKRLPSRPQAVRAPLGWE